MKHHVFGYTLGLCGVWCASFKQDFKLASLLVEKAGLPRRQETQIVDPVQYRIASCNIYIKSPNEAVGVQNAFVGSCDTLKHCICT